MFTYSLKFHTRSVDFTKLQAIYRKLTKKRSKTKLHVIHLTLIIAINSHDKKQSENTIACNDFNQIIHSIPEQDVFSSNF